MFFDLIDDYVARDPGIKSRTTPKALFLFRFKPNISHIKFIAFSSSKIWHTSRYFRLLTVAFELFYWIISPFCCDVLILIAAWMRVAIKPWTKEANCATKEKGKGRVTNQWMAEIHTLYDFRRRTMRCVQSDTSNSWQVGVSGLWMNLQVITLIIWFHSSFCLSIALFMCFMYK